MPDTYTPYLNLTLCEVGASRDTWGAKWNTNLTTLDSLVYQSAPIGMVADFAGPNAPSGWLICDGRTVSRITYSALFAVIGTYWGVGDGSTTFALPNLKGRAAVGPGVVIDQAGNQLSLSFTQSLGYIWGQILQAHLPNYNLVTDTQGYHSHSGATAPGGNHTHSTDAQGQHSHGGATAGENANHYHTGTTDTQGSHSHFVNAWATSGGGAFAIGSVATQGGVTTSTDGAHAHNFATSTESAAHLHAIAADGNHAHNISYSGNLQLGIYGDGNHAHNVSLGGGGQWFEVLNPVLVITKIIYAGKQASTMVAVADASAPVTIDGVDELAIIREELAALRAILAPPTQRPRLSAPMRGPH